MKIFLLLMLCASSWAESMPASAHDAFKARTAYADSMKALGPGEHAQAGEPTGQLAICVANMKACQADELVALTDYYTNHLKDVPGNTSAVAYINSMLQRAKARKDAKLPIFADLGQASTLGNAYYTLLHKPDWIGDLCNGDYKGPHHSN